MSTDHVDALLRQDAVSWRDQLDAPADFDAHLEQVRAGDARGTHRRRSLLPALAAASVVILTVAAIAVGDRSGTTSSPSGQGPDRTLSSRERSLALRLAHLEAEGSNPNHPGPIVSVRGWPAYVTSVSASVLTHDRALRYLDNSTSGAADVPTLVIEMRGRFSFETSGPVLDIRSHQNQAVHGTVLIAVASLAPSNYGMVTDAGLFHRHKALANATKLYSR